MSRNSRYPLESAITSNPKTTDNGYGGVKRAASATVVVASYAFNAWPVTVWQRSKYVEEYGLSTDADVLRITGAYDATIATGQFITIRGGIYKLLGVRQVDGRFGTAVALAMVAHRVNL